MSATNYSSIMKLEHTYIDSNGQNVKVTHEFDTLDASHEDVCEKFADFLRGIGYSYIDSVVAYKVGEVEK